MQTIQILLSPALYIELCEVSAGMDEPGYGPEQHAAEVVIADLASRRLSRMPARYRHGTRRTEPVTYQVMLPEVMNH
jgi:hypothetical protein